MRQFEEWREANKINLAGGVAWRSEAEEEAIDENV